RALRGREPDDDQWIELARDVCAAAPRLPMPELRAFFAGADGPARLAALLDHTRTLAAAATDAAIRTALAAALPEAAPAPRALASRADSPLVAPRGGVGELWAGPRPAVSRRAIDVVRPLPDGVPALVDLEGAPIVSLAPLAQARPPSPGAPDELFLFAGRDR